MKRVLAWPLGIVALGTACAFAPSRSAPEEMASAPTPQRNPAAKLDPPGQAVDLMPTTDAKRPATPTGLTVSRLYRENCVSCHGENGQGGGAGTSSLLNAEKFRAKWDKPYFEAILKGVPDRAMPAYAEVMTDEEIWGLVVHIRELQRNALRAEGKTLWADSKTRHSFKEEVIADGQGLRTPWSIGFLPGDRQLVTNRGGELFLLNRGKLTPISGVPESAEVGQGGLMDVVVHPNYAKNGWIYLSLAQPLNGNRRKVQTTIVRGKLRGTAWTGTETIFRAPDDQFTGAGVHFGSKIVLDGKGLLYFSLGERAGMIRAQDANQSVGKIYRINEDGSIPNGNPFTGSEVARKVWSMGHRNPQGLALDLKGRLWTTEHGPRGGDELNLIQPGRNYGWPTHAFSINYDDRPFRTPWPKPGEDVTQPQERWLPSIGASGLATYDGKAFPQWKGDLLAGGLAGTNLDRIRVDGQGRVMEHEELLFGRGRVRDVRVGPDGLVYVVLNGPDRIIRLRP